jgi:hypothetical protein
MENILSEFDGVSLGDARLNERALKIVARLQNKPSASFPRIFDKTSELEAFYRFIENPCVDNGSLLEPHITATVGRALECGNIIVLHDSTKFVFSGEREGLSRMEPFKSTCFFGHASLAFSTNNEPLGILRFKTWVRNSLTKNALRKSGIARSVLQDLPSEQDRWFEGIRETSRLFERPETLIHVCDSEGDDYALFAALKAHNVRFIIRAAGDRRLVETGQKVFASAAREPILVSREVELSKRTGKSSAKRLRKRESRTATLEIRCTQITIRRPPLLQNPTPKGIELNAVYVLEKNAPEGTQPVEWLLYTSEPVSTIEQVLAVVDHYRARWSIEEYFKALKTGCSYESRQLESYDTLRNCLALFAPIAWLMLSVRFIARTQPEKRAEDVLPGVLLQVLRLESEKPIKTAQEALFAVAGLGGHIKNNGPPGWLVLWRGFCELAQLTRGFLLAKSLLDVSKKM